MLVAFLRSARQGDLPLLVLLIALHSFLVILSPLDTTTTARTISRHPLSLLLLSCNSVIASVSLSYLFVFYRRTVRTVFNNVPPPLLSLSFLTSFWNYFLLVRPVSILFRTCTARFRVLPQVLVLGEVRCGTTTLCSHLCATLPGCRPPFCPWKHPELDGKETFYFAGHYFGSCVDPSYYSLCFPLRIERWFTTVLLGRPFCTFDGCAQYLSSPLAPFQLSRLYAERGLPPPLMIACVREPLQQAMSWYEYECQAIEWAKSMCLNVPNKDLRGGEYPPNKSFKSAMDYSLSDGVRKQYELAEELAKNKDRKKGDDETRNSTFPEFCFTWPGGQLGVFGRSGLFSRNVDRFEKAFGEAFPAEKKRAGGHHHFTTIVDVEDLNDYVRLEAVLRAAAEAAARGGGLLSTEQQKNIREYAERAAKRGVGGARNKGANKDNVATENDKIALRKIFEGEKERLETFAGRKLNWS